EPPSALRAVPAFPARRSSDLPEWKAGAEGRPERKSEWRPEGKSEWRPEGKPQRKWEGKPEWKAGQKPGWSADRKPRPEGSARPGRPTTRSGDRHAPAHRPERPHRGAARA